MHWPRRFSFLLPTLALAGAAEWPVYGADRVVITAPAGASVDEIVRRAVAGDEQRHQRRLGLECDQTLTTEHLNEQGAVIKTKTARLVHREGAEFAYFVKDDSLEAHRAMQDGDTVKAEHSLAVMNLGRLAPRFQCTLVDEARIQDRVCYVVAFSPRPGQKAATTEQKVIDQLHGQFWIDENSYEILQGEGSLTNPVSVGPFASVQQMSFAFHNRRRPGGEAEPADFTVEYIVKAPFYFFHQRQTNKLEGWRPARD